MGVDNMLFSEQHTSRRFRLTIDAEVAVGKLASRFFQLEISKSRSVLSIVAHTCGCMCGGRVELLRFLMNSPFSLVLPSGKNSMVDPSKSVVGDVDDEEVVGSGA